MVVELSKDIQAQYNKLIFSKLQYRNSRTGARSTRTQIDHDVFEGLPVRHWRKRSFNVNAAPEKDSLDPLSTGDTGWPELPMPRDAHMYSPMSEALLRAARMGQVKKPATPLMDDEKEPGEEEDADGDFDMGFVAKRWAVVPKDMEGPEPEFLAKRRKGLPSVYTGATGPLGNTAQMRKTKIRKVDMEGHSYIWEVLVPEGQAVDGEIVEEEISPTQAPAPGTVVEGLGVVNAEGLVIAGDQAMPAANRRRPPPPKRKAKGPGRGRKKKVAFMSGTEGTATANGISAVLDGSNAGVDGAKSAKMEHEVRDGDTEMGDENVLQEGEEGSEEGSEGEEGEDGDREEGELSPSPTPAKSSAEPPTIAVNDIKVEPAEIAHIASLSPSKVPLSSPAEPTREYSSDPMLLDDDDEPMRHSFSEPTMTSNAQSTESIAEGAAPFPAEVEEETNPTSESIPKPSEAIIEEPYAVAIVKPRTEAQVKSTTTPPLDTTLQPLPEPVEQPVTDTITESLGEQQAESLKECLTRPGTELSPGVPAGNVMEGIDMSTAEVVAEQKPSAPADLMEAAIPERRTTTLETVMTEFMPTSSISAVPEPTMNTTSTPMTEIMEYSKREPEREHSSEPPMESIMESIGESDSVAVQSVPEHSIAEQRMPEQPETKQAETKQAETEQAETEQAEADQAEAEQAEAEQAEAEHAETEQPEMERLGTEQPEIEQPEIEQSGTEQSGTEQPGTEQPGTEQPKIEPPTAEPPTTELPMTEPLTTETPATEPHMIEQPETEQPETEQPETEPSMTEPSMTEPSMTEPSMTEPSMTEPSMTEPSMTEPSMTEPSMTELSMTEPWVRPATEPFPEAVSPERRFSYTRVTSSPQAPTPSPPTPIENTFGLTKVFVSPKAPTMSPPTPIERSMSSSPDIPLADQHFRLPPHIDAMRDVDQAPASDMPHIAGADPTSVEEASNVEPRVNAHIPVEHNPVDGMAEPRIAEELEGSTQHFTDGEEDLLGSLERSLGKPGGSS